jgi:hypothetical protein
MIPIISYRANKLPFILELPIVRKRLTETSNRNFNNKKEFTGFVNAIKPSKRVDGYVGITCSCGHQYDYATKNDVPSTDVVCSCGRDVLIYGP